MKEGFGFLRHGAITHTRRYLGDRKGTKGDLLLHCGQENQWSADTLTPTALFGTMTLAYVTRSRDETEVLFARTLRSKCRAGCQACYHLGPVRRLSGSFGLMLPIMARSGSSAAAVTTAHWLHRSGGGNSGQQRRYCVRWRNSNVCCRGLQLIGSAGQRGGRE